MEWAFSPINDMKKIKQKRDFLIICDKKAYQNNGKTYDCFIYWFNKRTIRGSMCNKHLDLDGDLKVPKFMSIKKLKEIYLRQYQK